MKFKMNKIYFLVISSLLLLSVNVNSFANSDDENVDVNSPPVLALNATDKEKLQWKQDFIAWAERNGKIKYLSGEKTKGGVISINNQKIKLPDDTFVAAYVVDDEGLSHDEETQKHLPFYTLKRGNSTIMIAESTGIIVNYIGDKNDINPFGFLGSSIKGSLEGVIYDGK